jgi:predicted kinase
MKNMVYLLVGAPGSGKSTYGLKMVADDPTLVRLCPDEFRAKFGNGEGDQSVSAKAFEATRDGMRNALKEGKNVLIDATNMARKSRKDFVAIARAYFANITAIVFLENKEVLLERNKLRGQQGGRDVPEYVIDRMMLNYERPVFPEVDDIIMFDNMT